jgi:hypothetical protein
MVETWHVVVYLLSSSALSFPLLRWKGQAPKLSIDTVFGLIFINIFFFGFLPIAPFFMKIPPDKKLLSSSDYYQNGKIWIWNK